MRAETVLIVDENDDFREALKDLLQEVGLSVCAKLDMQDALADLRTGTIVNFALIDLYPVNSNNLWHILVLKEEFPHIIVVGMTGSLEVEDHEKAKICGLHAVFHKPFHIQDICKFIKKFSTNAHSATS